MNVDTETLLHVADVLPSSLVTLQFELDDKNKYIASEFVKALVVHKNIAHLNFFNFIGTDTYGDAEFRRPRLTAQRVNLLLKEWAEDGRDVEKFKAYLIGRNDGEVINAIIKNLDLKAIDLGKTFGRKIFLARSSRTNALILRTLRPTMGCGLEMGDLYPATLTAAEHDEYALSGKSDYDDKD